MEMKVWAVTREWFVPAAKPEVVDPHSPGVEKDPGDLCCSQLWNLGLVCLPSVTSLGWGAALGLCLTS